MVITYTSVCYLLVQNVRFCREVFHKRLDLRCSTTVKSLIKNYVDVIKCVENFEDLFCNIIFVLVLHDFCVVSIIVMDMMHAEKNWMSTNMFEALSYVVLIFGSLGILTIFAGNIPLEMADIKSVMLEKVFTQLYQDDSRRSDACVVLLLKKDVCVLTAGKAFVFDRGFLLKALATVIAQAVVVYQLGSSLSH
ncbi:hypothetical protein AVEN_65591-1 [Araneus ventricosus]|uniref:Gustatory receptor n=1 Tax=Araneus ventricosus TaxID=182803 RepID=A0A4Y2PQF4_ARAVE|nr:hypothetical protein AVEN_65591-1 [Araneus ventricosus]